MNDYRYLTQNATVILINERAPAAALLTKATLSVVATPDDRNFVVRGYARVPQDVVVLLPSTLLAV
jgi:hypothetical protein